VSSSSTRRTVAAWDLILVMAFALLVTLPGLLTPLGLGRSDPSRTGEARVERPSLRTAGGVGPWLQQATDWLRVSFALRQTMIGWDARLKMALALDRSYGSPVTLGRDGWLFYLVHRGSQGVRPELDFSPEELERWASALEARQRTLAARGVEFLVVFAPNKESIYPDLLPADLPAARARSRLDVLLDRLRAGGIVRVVDLRPALREARSAGSPFRGYPLYYRTDSHWNDLGAWLASRQVLAALKEDFPAVEIPSGSDLRLSLETTSGGDLARMQGLQAQFSDARVRLHDPARRCSFQITPTATGQPPETPLFTEKRLSCQGAPISRAIILHDSMAVGMLPALAPAFEQSLWRLGGRLDPTLLERERPDVVVQEFVERSLWEAAPSST
jgi:alginate O-acetyltransferase complex protein AlgJ